MGRRGLLWTCVSSALVLVLLLAEGLYRYSVRRQLSELVDQIVAGHPGWDRLCPEFTRFGNDSTMPEPSLTRDFFAWSTRKLGWSSELDVDGIPRSRESHAYLLIFFESWKEADKEVHIFIWSPRRHRFVSWDFTRCRRPDCPWQPGRPLSAASVFRNS